MEHLTFLAGAVTGAAILLLCILCLGMALHYITRFLHHARQPRHNVPYRRDTGKLKPARRRFSGDLAPGRRIKETFSRYRARIRRVKKQLSSYLKGDFVYLNPAPNRQTRRLYVRLYGEPFKTRSIAWKQYCLSS